MSTSSKPQFTDKRIQKMRANFTRFRILVIGRSKAGKTTILRRLHDTIGETIFMNGKKIESSALSDSSLKREQHNIEDQIIFESNPNFIFHKPRGFELGSPKELKLVQEFIERRSRARDVNDQLHAIWYCIPTDQDRPITAAENKFFNECGTGIVIVLWTKTESLDLAKIKQLTLEGKSKSEAMQQAPQKAWADFEKNTYQQFDRFKYPPKAFVVFRKMNEPGYDCRDLIEKTKAVLFNEKSQRLYTSTVNSTESVPSEDNKGDMALISAQNAVVNGGHFVSVEQGGFHIYNYHERRKNSLSGFEKLRNLIAAGALHDSEERHNPPKCYTATRRAVLEKIMEWAKDFEKIHHFMWLYGPTSEGKSAIAQTIAELCYDMHILAASFFFSRTAARRSDSTYLIATIAHQLCLSIPEVRCYIEAVVERDPDILRLSLEIQVQKLIIWPLSQVKFEPKGSPSFSFRPSLIVIDGLDECGDENMQRCILGALSGVFKSHGLPINFLVTSRPEQHIRDSFRMEPLSLMTAFLALDKSDNDIHVFLRSEFDEIKREHNIPVSWPSETDIKRLVQQSSGQFIYASAIIKYVKSSRPMERLGNVFKNTIRGGDNPFAEIDALYNGIFSSVDDIHTVLEVLGILLLAKEYWFPHTVNLKLVEDFLGLRGGALHSKLTKLHSILDIPALGANEAEIRILHPSLRYFLQDQRRSQRYYFGGCRAHAKLSRRFMTFIPSMREHHSMDELPKLSCQFFMVHCVLSYPTLELLAGLRNFDISDFLSLLSAYPLGLSSVTINRQISGLFAWLKHHSNNIPLAKDIYTSYILAWDKHITSLMEAVPFRLSALFIASALHPQFWKHATVIQEIINWKEPQDEVPRFSNSSFHFLCAGEPDEEEPDSTGYYKMLSQFLNDPGRSGPFYADEAKYACLATKTVQFITDREIETSKFTFTDFVLPYDDLRIWASECLPFFLSKTSHTEVLGSLLEYDLLPLVKRFKYSSQKKSSEVIDAVTSYIYKHMAEG